MYTTKVHCIVYCRHDTLQACELKFINCVSGPYMQFISILHRDFTKGYNIKKKSLDCFLLRTSDSLNEGLPIKMTREKFQRK